MFTRPLRVLGGPRYERLQPPWARVVRLLCGRETPKFRTPAEQGVMDFHDDSAQVPCQRLPFEGARPWNRLRPEPVWGSTRSGRPRGAQRRAPAPSWLTLLERWHRDELHPVPLLLDAGVVTGGFVASGASLAEGHWRRERSDF